MQAHLVSINDEMWSVIEDGPIEITKVNTDIAITAGAPQIVPKPKAEWTAKDRKRANLDNMARNVLYQTLSSAMFSNIKSCKTAKDIWDKLTMICEGTDQIRENKLNLAVQKFENFKMKDGETIDEMDARFTNIINELSTLGKDYSTGEIALKILRGLPREWDMKVTAMMESKKYLTMSTYELFSDLKAYTFELERRESGAGASSTGKSIALAAMETKGKG